MLTVVDRPASTFPSGPAFRRQLMAMANTPGLTVEISPRTDHRGEDDRTRRLSEHFRKVSARYRTLRELDLAAVGIISEAVARVADPRRPVRLLDVATGSGR